MQANSDNKVKVLTYRCLSLLFSLLGIVWASEGAEGLLKGKNVALLGDSNTWIGGDACDNPKGWNYWFARETAPAHIRSYARSGATWTHLPTTTADLDGYSEVIADNNVVCNQVLRLIEAVRRKEEPEPDIVMISAGTNDAWFPHLRPQAFSRKPSEVARRDEVELLSMPPGKILSLPEAVRYDLLLLQMAFPNASLIVMTPLQSIKISEGMLADVSVMIEETALAAGAAVIRQDILCPVDREAEMTSRRLTSDGTHTSEEGARRNAGVIIDCLSRILDAEDGKEACE